jgi:hypothetical protein
MGKKGLENTEGQEDRLIALNFGGKDVCLSYYGGL